MLNKLEKVVSVLTALAAVAYSLGWLKTYSYFQSFGIGLSSLDFAVQDYLFESWFVLENVVFFILFAWVLQAALRLRPARKLGNFLWCALLGLAGLAYLITPLATAWAFVYPDSSVLAWLLRHYYSVLKFAPFVLFLLLAAVAGCMVWRASWRWAQFTDAFQIPYKHPLVLMFLAVLFAWSISLAKHIGGINANQVLQSPDMYLSKVTLHMASDTAELKLLETNPNLYGLYESPKKYFIWDSTGFVFGKGSPTRILVIPHESVAWIQSTKKLDIAPGSLFF